MMIEIWSDIVCPWCYIGKRRFEAALAAFPHRHEVEVVWRSFELDPGAPRERSENTTEHLSAKFGTSPAEAEALQDRVTALTGSPAAVRKKTTGCPAIQRCRSGSPRSLAAPKGASCSLPTG